MARKPTKRTTKRRTPDRGAIKAPRHLDGVKQIRSNDYELLRKFMTDHGKIMPARTVGASAKQQRQIKRSIRRARVMGLLP
ncbi:MAG: 30S ribosomal protein S18 [Lentisphaerae bacterium]|nr:30S ribosomal protein S18 [Lentisphaerota bacterium]